MHAHNTEAFERGPESLSSGVRHEGPGEAPQPDRVHMQNTCGKRLARRRPVACSETRVTSCGPSPDTTLGLAFYFVACCYRAINSGPVAHTLHLLGGGG